jgi:hypothetical protein
MKMVVDNMLLMMHDEVFDYKLVEIVLGNIVHEIGIVVVVLKELLVHQQLVNHIDLKYMVDKYYF